MKMKTHCDLISKWIKLISYDVIKYVKTRSSSGLVKSVRGV
jgi:hypothetical protein